MNRLPLIIEHQQQGTQAKGADGAWSLLKSFTTDTLRRGGTLIQGK